MSVLSLLMAFAISAPVQQDHATPPPSKPAVVVHRELQTHPDWPKARPTDVNTIRSLVEAFFDAISAPAGGTLDRERLRSLFVPDGRIEIPIPATGERPTDVVFLSPDQYAESSDTQTATQGFFDHVLALRVQQFGVMAHVYASYESRIRKGDLKPFVRGVKSFELLTSNGRWYIVQVAWDRERADNPIPDDYLHDSIH